MSVLFKDKITGIWKRAATNLIYASFPVGSIVAYGGSSDVAAPAGCMYCHGQVLNESDYPDLYAVIGTKFGTGDGSAGSFNLPDLQGEFLRGAGTNSHSGQGSGSTVGAHQDATTVPRILNDNSSTEILSKVRETVQNADTFVTGSMYEIYVQKSSSSTVVTSSEMAVRPTNTSVEYIIKVVK